MNQRVLTMRTNAKVLVEIAIQGKVANPLRFTDYSMDQFGKGHAVPTVGGIVYNVKVGDSAFGWAGDHIEPGVSTILDEAKRQEKANRAYNFLACCGNVVRVITGAAKGAKGVVCGHHGGVEHLMIDFSDTVLRKLTNDDKFLIRAVGQGLCLTDFPDISCYNLDPRLLRKMGIQVRKQRCIVPVAGIVPGSIMGSGLGHGDPASGDYDITTMDNALIRKHQLDKLRLGDIVALMDCDNTFGRHYLTNAVTIGVVVHSDSKLSGHGPGVMTLLSSRTPILQPKRSVHANIGRYLGIGRYRK